MKPQHTPHCTLVTLASLVLAATAWGQAPVPIANAGFEDPVVENGSFQGGLPVGWTSFGTASFGILNPSTTDYLAEAPEGQNVAGIYNAVTEAGLSQTLSGSAGQLIAGASYSLSVKVGNPESIVGFPGYKIQLLASGTVLAENDNTSPPAAGVFVTASANYTYNAGLHSALVGMPLEIRLVSKATNDGEVDFDDVQLTFTLAEPAADPGGPYVVGPGQSLTLNASGSLPSSGQSITTYEWDLNNDNNFSDLTGVSPAAISYLDLKSIWNMNNGPNTIQLRVTDSSAKQATTSTTVTLVSAVPTPGFGLYLNAAVADDVSEYWNDLVSGNPTGLGLRVDKAGTQAVNRVAVTGSSTLLSHAFAFPGGFTGNNAGALLVNSNTTTTRSFNNIGWATQNVSMEMWIKPNTINPPTSNGQILFEDGGGTGMGFFIVNNQIRFRKITGTGDLLYNLNTDPLGVLNVPATSDFIQIVGTYDAGTGAMQLFVNGRLVTTATGASGSWTGGDAAAFGTLGGNNVGGLGTGQQSAQSFGGQMALIRVYSQKILNAQEVFANYRAIAPDTSPPTIAATHPANNASGVYPGIGSLKATFGEDVELTGQGSVTLKNLSTATEQVINLPNAAVAMDGTRNLIITLGSNLAFNTSYAVRISSGALRDVSGNGFAGIADDTTWTFSTAAQNLNPPLITAKSPLDNSAGVAIGADIVATFDQDILLGSGNIIIRDLNDDSTTQTIPVTDASQVTAAGSVLTINPSAILAKSRAYAVQIPSSAVRNFSDVNFAGITNLTDWNFVTANLNGQLGILDVAANGGLNPATNQAWKHADRYRLVFISSGTLNARDTDSPSAFGSWDSINTWNAEAQKFANNAAGQSLSGATWKVLGSTPTVNARDNTATNPNVHGSGHPIMLIDGKTIVAGNFNELWGGPGNQIRNLIRFTENVAGGVNQHINDAPPIWWPITGTNVSGVNLGAGGSLRNIQGGGSIRQGQGDNLLGWIDRANFTVAAQSSTAMAIYVMSDPLFVIDRDDAVAPNFVSITDNAPGGTITFPNDSVVYTVTFNEAMLPSTVTAADFGNAGSAGITINSVVQQQNPAEFRVTVTPTGPGTLQLRINQGAVLTDLNGNPLNTNPAILDDTLINVVGGTPFGIWSDGFAGLTNSDPSLDFDKGGLATGLEWVLGGDPTNPGDDAGIAPTFNNTSDPDFFIFTYRRTDAAAADPNTAIAVQYGSNLTGWTTAVAGADIIITPTDNGAGPGIDLVEVKIRRTLAVGGKLFVRLNVVVNQP
jgi:hypothetical protein